MPIPDIKLREIGFQPIQFQPIQYKATPNDYNLLQKSLAQVEQRRNTAVEKKSALDIALGKLESELHKDEETANRFAAYKQDIENKINAAVDLGDFGNAIRQATSLAGEVAKDPQWIGRVQSNEAYENWKNELKQRIGRGISQDTYDYAIKHKANQYYYKDSYDADGNIIMGETFKPGQIIYDDINFAQLVKLAADYYVTDKLSSTTGGNTELRRQDGTSTSRGGRSGSAIEEKTEKDILDVVKDFMATNTDIQNQVAQRYNVDKTKYLKLKQEYDSLPEGDERTIIGQRMKLLEQTMFENGNMIDLDRYIAKNVYNTDLAKAQAFLHKTTESIGNNSDDYYVRGVGGGRLKDDIASLGGSQEHNVRTANVEEKQDVDTNRGEAQSYITSLGHLLTE